MTAFERFQRAQAELERRILALRADQAETARRTQEVQEQHAQALIDGDEKRVAELLAQEHEFWEQKTAAEFRAQVKKSCEEAGKTGRWAHHYGFIREN